MEVRSIEAIVTALNNAGVQYLIVGGLAVNAHGFVRLTRDVDLLISLERENILRALSMLLQAGYRLAIPERPESFADTETRERWRREPHMVQLQLWPHQHQGTPIDIFVYEPFPVAEEVAKMRPMERDPCGMAPIVSLQRLLEMKRVAGRAQDKI